VRRRCGSTLTASHRYESRRGSCAKGSDHPSVPP
jgi:hypothetical protein